MIKRIIMATLMGIFGIIFSILVLPCIVGLITIYMIGVCIMAGYNGEIFGEKKSQLEQTEQSEIDKYKNI